jgi:hypothetical protein
MMAAASCAAVEKAEVLAIPVAELGKAASKPATTTFNLLTEISPNAPFDSARGVSSQWRSAVSVATYGVPDAATTDGYGRAILSSAGVNGVRGELEIHVQNPANSYVFTCQVSSFELVAEIADGAGGVTLVRATPYTSPEGRKFASFVWPNADTMKPLVFAMGYDAASSVGEAEWTVERCQIIEYS